MNPHSLCVRRRIGCKCGEKRRKFTLEAHCPIFKSGYQNVSVWGEFLSRGCTSSFGTVGSSTSETYRVIIHNNLLPFMYDTNDGPATFVLQEDNCGPRRAKNIATYLQNEEVPRMELPAQCPGLNSIENIWGLMKAKLCKRCVHPRNPIELFGILNHIWNSLPSSYCQN